MTDSKQKPTLEERAQELGINPELLNCDTHFSMAACLHQRSWSPPEEFLGVPMNVPHQLLLQTMDALGIDRRFLEYDVRSPIPMIDLEFTHEDALFLLPYLGLDEGIEGKVQKRSFDYELIGGM